MIFLLDFARNLLNSIRDFWWAVRVEEGEEGGLWWGSWDWEWEREETGRSRLLGEEEEEEEVVGVETFRRLEGWR